MTSLPQGKQLLLRLQQVLDGEDVDFPLAYLEKCLTDHDLKLQAIPIICRDILEMRIIGKGEAAIREFLIERFRIDTAYAEDLMNLASLAGREAADVEDLIKDPSVAVDEMVYEHLIDRDLAIALVNMAINMYHEKIDELNEQDRKHDMGELYKGLGVSPEMVEVNLKVSRHILLRLENGKGREEIIDGLVSNGILDKKTADAFYDDVMLAKKASDRIRSGEDGLEVFEDLRLQDFSAYVMILAITLVEESN